jgi:hypothetical protein
MPAPLALFVYDRPGHVRRVVEGLRANALAAETDLFIFSDAPKSESRIKEVSEIRALARGLQGFKSIELVEQSVNQGIAGSIVQGVTRLTAKFGRVIVLEDDLLPSRHFLRYMNDALNTYANDDRVISVHAYSYPVASKLPETFFLLGADCWGWATWKRSWDLFEPDGRKLLSELERRRLSRSFDFEGSYPYTQMLRDGIAGMNDSWAIRWYASAFLHGKLTLYPGSSQVRNIGADGSGIHVGSTRSFENSEWGRPLDVGSIRVEVSQGARRAFAAYLARLRPSMATRVLGRLKRLMSAQVS